MSCPGRQPNSCDEFDAVAESDRRDADDAERGENEDAAVSSRARRDPRAWSGASRSDVSRRDLIVLTDGDPCAPISLGLTFHCPEGLVRTSSPMGQEPASGTNALPTRIWPTWVSSPATRPTRIPAFSADRSSAPSVRCSECAHRDARRRRLWLLALSVGVAKGPQVNKSRCVWCGCGGHRGGVVGLLRGQCRRCWMSASARLCVGQRWWSMLGRGGQRRVAEASGLARNDVDRRDARELAGGCGVRRIGCVRPGGGRKAQ